MIGAIPLPFTGVTITVPDAALLPIALVASTEQVYVVVFVSPVTTIGEAVLVPLPIGVHVAV